ncbi:DUF983 domain-containing protein [Bradyrhizobium sp. LHD-71]|uniref:DUF983 domain-containing protein n=1 Tax=Bradyrhizobium sp. LHD-71 TaxID=3072141 RepID=UPI00280C9EC9|nr:DUF983 domain-containing protein [Bradyrhizobium sp. LHD-71]MDQ8726258.1 DUF983 domain-containing protein [Bradyrhizobium sp. LHD-71]
MTEAKQVWTNQAGAPPKRDLFAAMLRGFHCRCPNCGEGKLFRAYLKTRDSCSVCGQDFHHHRADDLPAYLVIVIVGHIIVPLVLAVEQNFQPSYLVHLAVWLPLTLGMSLALLQPIKGAIVGLQWAFRMHGFDENGPADPLEAGLRDKKT